MNAVDGKDLKPLFKKTECEVAMLQALSPSFKPSPPDSNSVPITFEKGFFYLGKTRSMAKLTRVHASLSNRFRNNNNNNNNNNIGPY